MKEVSELTLVEVCTELRTYTNLFSDEWQESIDGLIDITRSMYLYDDALSGAINNQLIAHYITRNAR